jgi:hypothetical protein
MANCFTDRILYYIEKVEVLGDLSSSQEAFIEALKLALKKPIQEHRVRSGAAFLFWMYGISNLEDIRNAVTGFMRAGRNHTENVEDHENVTKKVESSIDAIKATFTDPSLYNDPKGKSQTIKKGTKIAPRLLRQWSDHHCPLKLGEGSLNAAMISLLYEPLASVERWGNNEEACIAYLSLLAKHYAIDPAPTDLNPLALLAYYVKKFELSAEVEDEEAEDEVEDEMIVDDTNRTEKISTAKVKKGKIKSMSMNNGDNANLQNLIGISYPAGRGYRTIVGITEDDRLESVPQSQWKRYVLNHKSEQEQSDWFARFPHSKKETEEWPIELMSYECFCALRKDFSYRLVISQTGKVIPVLTAEDGKGKVIKVNEMSGKDYIKLLEDLTAVNEEDYKPGKKRADKDGQRDESFVDDIT